MQTAPSLRPVAAVVFACALASGQNPQCPLLSTCTDKVTTRSEILCNRYITGIVGSYCREYPPQQTGFDCTDCTCRPGCEGDGGDGKPQNWRPGLTNPLGAQGTSADGFDIALSQFQINALLERHNSVRRYHGACPLTWSPEIANNIATTNPNNLWEQCFQFSFTDPVTRAANRPGGFTTLGENAVRKGGTYWANNFPTDLHTNEWYMKGIEFWDFSTSSSTGGDTQQSHTSFTQVVWKASTHIGCRMWQCDRTRELKTVVLVCQYGPTGNVDGQFAQNVGQPNTTPRGCSAGPAPATRAPTRAPAPVSSVPDCLELDGYQSSSGLTPDGRYAADRSKMLNGVPTYWKQSSDSFIFYCNNPASISHKRWCWESLYGTTSAVESFYGKVRNNNCGSWMKTKLAGDSTDPGVVLGSDTWQWVSTAPRTSTTAC